MISIVIPTKNSAKTLEKCLESIASQTFRDYELIIVDGNSKDSTEKIARRFTDMVFVSSASLPASRNLGFSEAKGEIFLSIDSDMILEPDVLKQIAQGMDTHGALIVPEVGYGTDFLSRCKDLEKRCYIGDSLIEASRAFARPAFGSAGGYDPNLHFGEDWDLHLRISKKHSVGRIQARILHNTQDLSLPADLKKAYIYGKSLPGYLAKDHAQSREWLNPKSAFFVRHFSKLCQEPILAIGITFIKSMEYCAGILGYMSARLERRP